VRFSSDANADVAVGLIKTILSLGRVPLFWFHNTKQPRYDLFISLRNSRRTS